MVESMVNSCLPEFSDFTRVFTPVRVLCNGPLVSEIGEYPTMPAEVQYMWRNVCLSFIISFTTHIQIFY